MQEAKPYSISKKAVIAAYQKVKANKGTYGVDEQSIEDFERKLNNNLYKIWNRMSSGTYFPQPVKAVAIPKKNGGTRILGIPTVEDRIAQMVAKLYFEPNVEPIFYEDSYGYRPNKSATPKTIYKNLSYMNRKYKCGFDDESIYKVANARLGWYRRSGMNVVNFIISPMVLETKIKDGAGLLNPLNYYLR